MEIADAGAGFDPTVASQKGGLGIMGMRERAEILGGSFEIVSSPRQGTAVCVYLPLTLPEMQNG